MAGDELDDFALGDMGDDDLEFGDIGLSADDLDLDAFDLDFGDAPSKVETRYCKPKFYRGERKNAVTYDRAVDLVREMSPAILDGERLFAVVSGNFIFGDFIEAFAVENNLFIDDLTISTLAISKDNVDSLHNLLAGDYLGKLNLIVSDYWYSHNRVNLGYLYEQLDVDNKFQLAIAGTHTKITLMRAGDRKMVMHGSANFRSSRSVESFVIETDRELYDFNLEWHSRVVEQYATIRKAIRVGPLFDLITGEGK